MTCSVLIKSSICDVEGHDEGMYGVYITFLQTCSWPDEGYLCLSTMAFAEFAGIIYIYHASHDDKYKLAGPDSKKLETHI